MIRSLDGISPQIHPTAFVSEAAYVVGDVVIGEGSSVWPGSVVRGDMGRVTIGKYTNVQDNSVVHCDTDTTIGDYVTIGHRVVCHAKSVGDRSLLGNGSVVNDGVVDRRRVRHRLRRRRAGRHAGAGQVYLDRRAGAAYGAKPRTATWSWASTLRACTSMKAQAVLAGTRGLAPELEHKARWAVRTLWDN